MSNAQTGHSAGDADAPGVAERLSPRVRRLLAPNPGPFTFKGTCAYLIGDADEIAIVDPGPADDAHVAALLAALGGARLAAVLVTHTHRDHSPAAARLREATGAPVLGCAPFAPIDAPALADAPRFDASHDKRYAPDRILTDGETLRVSGAALEVVATPGHTANHLCYALLEEASLFTGDHIMAWSTTLVAPPDGNMRAYMESIEKLRQRGEMIYWPAHGGPVREPQRHLRALVHHRRQREQAILTLLDRGTERVDAIVERIYEGVDRRLFPAATMNVLAHLEDLIERSVVAADGPLSVQARYRRA
jgi:glyoxylase-like metal-dependent hydrolase (beta-lactamase superfamily II)